MESGSEWQWVGTEMTCSPDSSRVGCKCGNKFQVMYGCVFCEQYFTGCWNISLSCSVILPRCYGKWDDEVWHYLATSWNAWKMQWYVVMIWNACCWYGKRNTELMHYMVAKYFDYHPSFLVLSDFDSLMKFIGLWNLPFCWPIQSYKLRRVQFAMIGTGDLGLCLQAHEMSFVVSYCAVSNIQMIC